METKRANHNKKHYLICADVVDAQNGLKQYDNIRMIRVLSKDYNLLIMEDYMPIIGEIDGSIEIVFDDTSMKLEGIHGYYMHKKNKFSLMIERRSGVLEKSNG